MPEHIVILLHSAQGVSDVRQNLIGLPSWAVLEPQFRGLPPTKAGEQAVISEMRRTMRFACPTDVDLDAIVRTLQEDPLVEYIYREPPAEPA